MDYCRLLVLNVSSNAWNHGYQSAKWIQKFTNSINLAELMIQIWFVFECSSGLNSMLLLCFQQSDELSCSINVSNLMLLLCFQRQMRSKLLFIESWLLKINQGVRLLVHCWMLNMYIIEIRLTLLPNFPCITDFKHDFFLVCIVRKWNLNLNLVTMHGVMQSFKKKEIKVHTKVYNRKAL